MLMVNDGQRMYGAPKHIDHEKLVRFECNLWLLLLWDRLLRGVSKPREARGAFVFGVLLG